MILYCMVKKRVVKVEFDCKLFSVIRQRLEVDSGYITFITVKCCHRCEIHVAGVSSSFIRQGSDRIFYGDWLCYDF